VKIMKNNKDDKGKYSFLRALSLFTQLGLSMVCCVVVGLLLGRFLDRLLGVSPWLMITFTIIGSAAAIKMIYDIGKDWK
jgi:ATP synthase protein I